MRLPYLNAIKAKADMQDTFLGYYNHPACDAGQFADMRNLSSDRYPLFSPRKPRRLIRVLADAKGLRGGSELSWVANGKLYYDGEAVANVSSETPQLVRMGAYLIVWPDKVIYNTHTGELTAMDASYTYAGVTVRPCTLTGQEYAYTASDTEPNSPAEQDYWYNTLTGGFYQYLGGAWQGIDTVYSRLEGPDLGLAFAAYDVVSISGFSVDMYNLEAATVYARGEDYIVIATGEIRSFDEMSEVTIKREAPELDYICEAGNRLWGCSSRTHEIRGSKLGDPTNWDSYLGISTDSYAATVGSAGDFTGICQYMGYVHFFKEGCIHRLYGTRPENYQLIELPVRGVKAGCWRSMAVVSQILYYVSRDGMTAFDGSSAVNVGEALGDVTLEEAVAGPHGRKLYLSAIAKRPGKAEETVLYVMDTAKGLWHIEDGTRAIAFADTPEGDFMLDSEGQLWTIDGAESQYETREAQDEGDISWWGVTGDMGLDSPNQKWVSRLTIRAEMARGARLAVDIEYNSDGRWERAMTVETEHKKSLTLPIRTRRCDHFRLRYAGTGECVIYTLAKTYDEGSERSSLTYRQ
mgnify:CR=1 FL=1